jgi:hypothetical protein
VVARSHGTRLLKNANAAAMLRFSEPYRQFTLPWRDQYVRRFGSAAQRIYGNRSRDPVAFSDPDCVQAHIRQCKAWQVFKCGLCEEVALHQVNTTAGVAPCICRLFLSLRRSLAARCARQFNHELHE